jgi:hypothetical protein
MDRRRLLGSLGQAALGEGASTLVVSEASAVPGQISLVAAGDCVLTHSPRRDRVRTSCHLMDPLGADVPAQPRNFLGEGRTYV